MTLPYRHIVLTGGAGFVGSNLAIRLKQEHPHAKVVALDNLYRRGSELALPRLKVAGVEFMHGDIRCKEDIAALGHFDLMVECSAEPSVRAGYDVDPSYLIHTNLLGTVHCLEAVRKTKADLVFLSTSRVYSIEKLQGLPLQIEGRRLALKHGTTQEGWSEHGISTGFSTGGSRSLYGTTKLASELLLEEYRAMYGLNILINRCGVIAGPWQMGKVDQGFVTLWIARHFFGGTLKYTGFGGHGHQVRDVLHIDDLYDLLVLQLGQMAKHQGKIYNVGGGLKNSTSLAELTDWCTEKNRSISIGSEPASHPSDIPYYVTDNRDVMAATGWAPKRSLETTLLDVQQWLHNHQQAIKPILHP